MVILSHLIIFRIAHLYLGRTIYISRIGTTRNGTEHVTVEDIYIGKTNHVTLLTATIYEVGRYAQAFWIVFVIHYTASIKQSAIHGRSSAFDILTHQNMGVAIYITLHTIARTVNVEAGIFSTLQQVVGILQLRLILASQHIALQVDGYVALDGTTLVAAAIDITSHVGIVLFIRLRFKLVLDGKLDERIFRVGKAQQIATCVGSLSLIVVVGIVAATYYLVGDGKTLREDVIHHVANLLLSISFLEVGCRFRINIHVATVTAAAEGADGAVGESFASCASVPGQLALDICFHWVEIQVDQVRIYLRTVFILCWQIEGTDYLVRWIVNPVDAVGKVQLLGIVLNATVQSLEHVHEVVLCSSGKEFITVTSHEHASDIDMAADVDFDVAHLLM